MNDVTQVHADQLAYWNGAGGERWVVEQAHTDAMLAPVAEAAIAHAAPRPGEHVLDIGCGCGMTTLALAEAVAPGGTVTGLDVSAPMLAVAQRRAEGRGQVAWTLADAAAHDFADATFDLLFSRFGVMFFGEPTAAFANLRRAAQPGARLVFACWRALNDNPWMLLPLQAAQTVLPPLPRPGPEDPGPFAFADTARVTRILTGAGWTAPTFTRLDVTLDIAGGGGVEAATDHATRIGAAARLLADQPEAARQAAKDAIRTVLAPHATADGRVGLSGGVWLVESRNG
ncbi:MAG TPA: class I SAM-dependent methyltransferase [Acetobacteraceae bacterium]|nr:class I SAM-dependent methyltransferase [Acetobacteraceae bacterium]